MSFDVQDRSTSKLIRTQMSIVLKLRKPAAAATAAKSLQSYFCIPVPYNEKDTFFLGVSSKRSCRSS